MDEEGEREKRVGERASRQEADGVGRTVRERERVGQIRVTLPPSPQGLGEGERERE